MSATIDAASATASKERLRAWLKLLKTARHIEKELRERFRAELDTTLPRFDVMAALDRAEAGLRMNELSRALRVSNGNVTGLVDRLAESGMVERQAVEGDRRGQLICLTRLGRTTFRAHAKRHEQWVDELLTSLNPSDVEQLMGLLDLANKEEP